MEIKGVKIEYLGHSGFFLSGGGKDVAIDPYNVSEKAPKAELILITHSHYDHCSIKDIQAIKKSGATVVIPADAQSKITKIDGVNMQIIEPGDELQFGNVKIEAVPAYNVSREFHPKREGWMGFIVKFKDVIVYHAGDSDKIPEMSRLTGYGKRGNEFIAFLPVSGKYVMGVEEAADVASLISPDFVIPMHYGAGVAGTREDAERFVKLCRERGLKADVLEKI